MKLIINVLDKFFDKKTPHDKRGFKVLKFPTA